MRRALSGVQRRRLGVLALVAGLAFFTLALGAELGMLDGAEWTVQREAQALRRRALERPMRAVSLLGTGWVLLPVAVAGALIVRARNGALAVALALTGAGALGAANLAKALAVRQRPNTVMWAYPSAHTFGIVVFVVMLLYALWALGAPRRWRRLALLAGLPLIVAVGLSRIYLNAHWLGDVLGGLTGGFAFALVALLIADRRRAAPELDVSPRLDAVAP
jgi:membrane-associated phospholipid phosphatase